MTQFQKKFIGKGSKVGNMDIVRITISKETLTAILENDLVKYEEKEYMIFEVAALRSQDNYGRTHTAYISKKTETKRKKKSPKTQLSIT